MTYVFQIDCAENNDSFFCRVPDVPVVFYRGAGFQVGEAPWIPDGIRIEVEEGPESGAPTRCVLTLIELEERRPEALRSSRKYLPEDPELILSEFRKHLRRKILECKSTGDPRETELSSLEQTLRSGISVTIRTACALRSRRWIDKMEEDLPLIGQEEPFETRDSQWNNEESLSSAEPDNPTLSGICKLDRDRTLALRRCVMVVDAVVRKQDHSSAALRAWLARAPLRSLLKSKSGAFPVVEQFILPEDTSKGTRIDFDALVLELLRIWSEKGENLEADMVRRLINEYFLVAERTGAHDRMDRVFEIADNIYAKHGASLQQTLPDPAHAN